MGLWDRNTVSEKRTNGEWSKILNHYRSEIEGIVSDQSRQKKLEENMFIILYNICGKLDFGTAKAPWDLREKLVKSNVYRRIVAVHEKSGRDYRKGWRRDYIHEFDFMRHDKL